MLRLNRWLPAGAHIAGLRVAHAVRLRWWKLAGSRVRGCQVLVLDGDGRVLLIRHSYGSGHWMLPGGGLARREDPALGATREVAEETGLALNDARIVGRTDDPLSAHETWLVAGLAAGLPRPDGREVIDAAFFVADHLPRPLSPRVARSLDEWITAAKAAHPAG